ncbi:helix-turn-helix domain-containing protein [Blautia sp.]|jgi:transcriptional regulator with XRE-family HTH domain|uniref:helix-turn-helix domain-containing protein n=1 Tax=Blautia sp. TaxID=1955243 RepID=UPI000E540D0F|nr:helix-turn-helix transcriptional regulator [Blautia sp.]RHO19935.1 XRE family transcriptional regulator [Ruminococcus sp. AM18-44]RHO28225.1 XRE family transcriptional regulator [Ruminococcus sp. AM18-15]RHS61157.1 XRE family transcriptional regulator [Ruminococcus sp. AM45-9BH]RHS76454.1 XRE family transcriptional regulator [Ruminococcus sp. AM45-2]RHT10794.1 XRE family transcriptional regulator [Ruminococcus sp. AM36-17]RHT35177.1 XRE family transcriptional regulator [Ruminococcus sp. AM
MDLKAVGQRIKDAREAKNLTQEELAALVNLSSTHVSVIERGLKVTKLDTFVAIANALDVSADELLVDVVAHSVTGVSNRLSDKISSLPMKEQKKIIKVIQALIEE